MSIGTATKRTAVPFPKSAEPYVPVLLGQMADAISIFDREWRYTYLNAAAFEDTPLEGKADTEIIGHSLWELQPHLVGTICDERFHQAIDQQVPQRFEYECPNGRWLEYHCYPTGEGVTTVSRDITDCKLAAETLRQRVEELRKIIEVAPALVMVAHNSESDSIASSDEASHPRGVTPCAGTNSDTLARFFSDGRELTHEELPMNKAAHGKDVRDVEVEVELPDGQRMVTSSSASPLRSADGKVRGCVSATLDITDRKKVEQALLEKEERFRALAHAVPNIAWSTDATGTPDFLNEWGYSYSGLSHDDALSELGSLVSLHPEDVEKVMRARKNAVFAGDVFELEYRILRASDRSYRWHLVRCVPVRDADGKVERWFGTCTDIEELKQAQALAAEREIWFHTLFDTIPLSAALIDPITRRMLQFNDAAANDLGYTREEFSKLAIEDIDATPSLQELERFFAERMRSGNFVVFERKHRNKAGALRDVIIYSRVMTMNGHLVANAVWHDVTEKKAAAAALLQSEKLASVGRMAATVAHEINNPLEMVTNCIYLAAHHPGLPPEVKEHLAMAERELQRVAHIAKRTLGFYRDTSKPTAVNLATLVDEVVELYAPKCAARALNLSVEHDSHCIKAIANEGEIRQVISNLLTNSIDASQRESTIRVRTGRVTLNDRSYTRVTVADAGGGIPAVNRSRIFEPFFTTKVAVGTGLGLWVSREVVRKHNGKMLLRSREGKGTVFSVLLPTGQ